MKKLSRLPVISSIIALVISNLKLGFDLAIKLNIDNKWGSQFFFELFRTDTFYFYMMSSAVIISIITLTLNSKMSSKNKMFIKIISIITIILAAFNCLNFYLQRALYRS